MVLLVLARSHAQAGRRRPRLSGEPRRAGPRMVSHDRQCRSASDSSVNRTAERFVPQTCDAPGVRFCKPSPTRRAARVRNSSGFQRNDTTASRGSASCVTGPTARAGPRNARGLGGRTGRVQPDARGPRRYRHAGGRLGGERSWCLVRPRSSGDNRASRRAANMAAPRAVVAYCVEYLGGRAFGPCEHREIVTSSGASPCEIKPLYRAASVTDHTPHGPYRTTATTA